ncbi:MAG: hypothetical protein KDA72_18475, partial [Planctomycetales bacterium]|nr:hypothetical protein [Planctomycetales bacterium]
ILDVFEDAAGGCTWSMRNVSAGAVKQTVFRPVRECCRRVKLFNRAARESGWRRRYLSVEGVAESMQDE